jgi:Na+-transporting methylmalonyl-CoA/oxaloacetate decarboxylase gamma subunit
MVKKVVIIMLVVLVTIAVVNDIGRYVVTWFNIDEVTRETTKVAASAANQGRDAAATAAVNYAATQDVTVYAYDQDESTVYVWTEKDLDGTWALGPILVTIQGGRLTDPYKVRSEHSRPTG